jgi:hypothetical protein
LTKLITPDAPGIPILWTNESVAKAGFESLIRLSVQQSWACSNVIFKVIIPQVLPHKEVDSGSAEALALNYVSDVCLKFYI